MAPPFDWTPEGDATLIRMLAEIDNLRAERDLYRYALRIIAGGHTYWSDEIGCGVPVWDTCLVDQSTLLATMVEELKREWAEKRAQTEAERITAKQNEYQRLVDYIAF